MKATPIVGIADVHAGPLADRLEAFQHLDAVLVVLAALGGSGRGGTDGRFFAHGLRERTRQGPEWTARARAKSSLWTLCAQGTR